MFKSLAAMTLTTQLVFVAGNGVPTFEVRSCGTARALIRPKRRQLARAWMTSGAPRTNFKTVAKLSGCRQALMRRRSSGRRTAMSNCWCVCRTLRSLAR
jgi:hypothetical protein